MGDQDKAWRWQEDEWGEQGCVGGPDAGGAWVGTGIPREPRVPSTRDAHGWH